MPLLDLMKSYVRRPRALPRCPTTPFLSTPNVWPAPHLLLAHPAACRSTMAAATRAAGAQADPSASLALQVVSNDNLQSVDFSALNAVGWDVEVRSVQAFCS